MTVETITSPPTAEGFVSMLTELNAAHTAGFRMLSLESISQGIGNPPAIVATLQDGAAIGPPLGAEAYRGCWANNAPFGSVIFPVGGYPPVEATYDSAIEAVMADLIPEPTSRRLWTLALTTDQVPDTQWIISESDPGGASGQSTQALFAARDDFTIPGGGVALVGWQGSTSPGDPRTNTIDVAANIGTNATLLMPRAGVVRTITLQVDVAVPVLIAPIVTVGGGGPVYPGVLLAAVTPVTFQINAGYLAGQQVTIGLSNPPVGGRNATMTNCFLSVELGWA